MQKTNIRDGNHNSELQLIQEEIPVAWQHLIDILNYEQDEDFLPADIAIILLKLLEIRRDTYRKI